MNECNHSEFEATVAVHKIHRQDDALPAAYSASFRVRCAGCGTALRFLGVESGLSHTRPMTSAAGDELHTPLEPASTPRVTAARAWCDQQNARAER